jgi:hypothetical protein
MVTGAPIRPHLLEQQIGWGAALLRLSIRLIRSCRIQYAHPANVHLNLTFS